MLIKHIVEEADERRARAIQEHVALCLPGDPGLDFARKVF